MITWVAWDRNGDPRQPQGRPIILRAAQVRATIGYLRACLKARAAGHSVAYTTDPEWLVDMAINRRAGWPDDPSCSRGSCMPVDGAYPKRASADYALYQFAHQINTIRWYPRETEVRWLPRKIRERIAHRIRQHFDD